MLNNQSDLLKNIFQQTHLGKMSLITLIQNLSDEKFFDIPKLIYDKNGRYLKLKKTFLNQSINNIIQQRTISVSPTLSIKERDYSIANQFNLSSIEIEKQYELALKNRTEIPPILMRRIIIDAIGILRIIINQLNQDQEKNSEKFQRISKRLNELEIYNKLFDYHC